MEFYNEKLLPRGLPELIYQVTPDSILKKLKVITYPRKERKGILGCCGGNGTNHIIKLYPTVIMRHSGGHGVLSFQYWKEFLEITLHEIGHAVDHENNPDRYNISEGMYKNDFRTRSYIEEIANNWQNQMIEKIAFRDPRLGQPIGFIGGLPGIYIMRDKDDNYKSRDNYRAYRVGGQYTLTNLVNIACSNFNDWNHDTQVRRMIKKGIEGFNRIYVDKAGRKYFFFNHGEMVQVIKKIVNDENKTKFKKVKPQITDSFPDDFPF